MVPKQKPTYIMIPRKLMIAWIVTFVSMLLMTILSIQWANYIDNRSNHRWCGIVTSFNESYKTSPPSTLYGQKLAAEMRLLEKEFHCEN